MDKLSFAQGELVLIHGPLKPVRRAVYLFDAWGDGRMARVGEIDGDRLTAIFVWSDLLRLDPDQQVPFERAAIAACSAAARMGAGPNVWVQLGTATFDDPASAIDAAHRAERAGAFDYSEFEK